MKINFLFLAMLVLGLSVSACNNDSDGDDDMSTPSAGEAITVQNVRAVFNFLPPNGYASTFFSDNLPESALGGYKNQSTDQNINVQAAENLTGEVINVTDQLVENAFNLSIDQISQRTVNEVGVYEAMVGNTYRAVMFRGQYQFDVVVENDPDPAEAEAEAALFIDLMTEAMTTF